MIKSIDYDYDDYEHDQILNEINKKYPCLVYRIVFYRKVFVKLF